MARSDTAGLRVVHDPGGKAIGACLASLAVCLAFAAYFGHALYRGGQSPYDDPSERAILLAGFVVGAVFFAGWAVYSLRGRRKTLRIYEVEDDDIVCRGGSAP
jgi:type VI protein secretion system component VasK